MCEQYQQLPGAGGVLDQDISFLRMRGILLEGGYFEDENGTPDTSAAPADPFAGIEMVTLG